MIPLTSKQLELLDFLRSKERCPSFQEMQDALGLRSKSGVHRLIHSLEERGYIRRLPNRARAIEVVQEPTLPSAADLAAVSVSQLAYEAKRRGLKLGHIYRDADGRRKFEEIAAA